jgi:DNA-binding response OmpR family regulator
MSAAQRVLIVDDDLVVGETFARMLKLAGYETAVVPSSTEGLAYARREHPAAVVLDFRMPGATGLGFLTEVRRDPAIQDLPVALVTGDRFLSDRTLDELRALGATVRYKPLYMEDLLALVRSLIGSAAAS